MKCSVKKFGGRAKVNVMFWISRFVERENTSEKIRSLIETRGKRGCSVDAAAAAKSHVIYCRCTRSGQWLWEHWDQLLQGVFTH